MNPVMEALKKGKTKGPEDEMSEVEEDVDIDSDEDEMAAARGVMSALKSGNAEAFAKSLKGFVQMCGGY